MSDSLKKEFICDMCKKPSTSAKICRCKMAIYCDEECQAKHWDKHKKECEKFRHLFNKNSNISSDSSDFADFEIPRDTKTDFDELDIFEYFENSQIDDFCDFETAQTPKISNNEKDIEKPKTQKSPENNNLSVIDEFEDYEKKSNLDAENRFVLNLSDFNEYNFTEGIKKLLLKFKFDESKLIPFPKMRDSWEIKNLDVMPPDGTFMLFERSSLKIDNFLSVTFYADFLPAKCAVREAHFQTLRAKKSDRSAYEHFYRREEKLRRRERKMSRFYSEAISQFLRNGIKVINSFRSDVNGIYRFAGHSNSQIKNNSCYLVKAPSAEIHQTLHSIGNFDEIDDLVKLVKYIGLLFSTVKSPIILKNSQWEVEPDIETADKKYCFTDGCGRISTFFMREIMVELALPFNLRTISAVQIRFKGFKGMLVHDPKASKIHFTKSMLKFNDYSVTSPLGVINWSRPYMPGYLILHYVLLLSTLGISDDVFEKKQRIYNEQLKKLLSDPFEAYEFIRYRHPDLAAKFRRKGICWEVITGLRSLKIKELTKFTKNLKTGIKHRRRDEIERVRIFVPKSRNVHGVRDTSGKLKYGQVFFCPTRADRETVPLRGKILVGRTPCYSPGDMRILTCVDPGDEYAHLIDVLVFPTDSQSARPHSDEMSGGDLDGDLYWCCWDPSLMPSRTVDAFDYSGPKAPIPRKSLSSETRERIDFFSQHDTDLLGTIDSLYFEFADRFKANCPECQELNHIFSNVVDYQPKYAKKTINQLRAKLRTIQERPRNFIWRRIEEENKKLRKEMSPNFGIVRIGHGDFMNNYGEKRNIEIFAADHDEPIFINNEEKYVGKFKHGDIVRFESKWSSFTNRYIASNVHLQNGMNINHLIKIMNVGICTGKIIQIFPSRDRDGDHSIERALGEISYKAYYLKQILSDSNESVPVSIVEFIESSFDRQHKIEDLYPGQTVHFNLAYDYRGKPLAMNISEAKVEEISLSEKEDDKSVKVIELSLEVKEKIIKLLKINRLVQDEDFKREYCLMYFSKLDTKRFGCENLTDLMKQIPEVSIRFDASADPYYFLNINGRRYQYQILEKNEYEIDFDKIEKEKIVENSADWKSDKEEASDNDTVFQNRCYYCGKDDHIPYDCKDRFANDRLSQSADTFDEYSDSSNREEENKNINNGKEPFDGVKSGSKMCYQFKFSKSCRFGEKCRFKHEKSKSDD